MRPAAAQALSLTMMQSDRENERGEREREEARRREEEKKASRAAKAAASNTSANQRASPTTRDWSWMAAIVTFIAGVAVAQEQLEMEDWPSYFLPGVVTLIAGIRYK